MITVKIDRSVAGVVYFSVTGDDVAEASVAFDTLNVLYPIPVTAKPAYEARPIIQKRKQQD